MNKYRVLKPYPKQITNSGRLITLKKGASVYLKKEAQVLRLVKMGYLKPVVALPKRAKPAPKPKAQPAEESKSEEAEAQEQSRRKSKSEYLNKKKKGKSNSQKED